MKGPARCCEVPKPTEGARKVHTGSPRLKEVEGLLRSPTAPCNADLGHPYTIQTDGNWRLTGWLRTSINCD